MFTTDGRIKALNLTVLDDDKKFFPQYNVAPVVRKPILDAHPAIAEVFNKIAPKLNNEMMLDLAAKVDVDGADPVTVAKDWLVKEGFIKLTTS